MPTTTPANKKAALEPIISNDRAQRALRDLNSGSADMKARAGRILSEYMEERGISPSSVATETQRQPSPAGAAPTARFAQTDIDAAYARGVYGERTRVSAVYASEHSRGRERGCATLLTASNGWSAAAILKELATLPKDGETAAQNSGRTSAERWDRAWNGTGGQTASAAAPQTLAQSSSARASARQDKANAKVYGQGGSVR